MPAVTCVDFFDQNIIQKPTNVGAGSGWIKLKGFYNSQDSSYLGYGSIEEAYALLLINKLYKLEYEIHITDQYGGVVENWKGVMPMMQTHGITPTNYLYNNSATIGFVDADSNYSYDGNMYVNVYENWKENGEIDQTCKSANINSGIAWQAEFGTRISGNVIYSNPSPSIISSSYFIDPINIPHYTDPNDSSNFDKIKIWEISSTGYSYACFFNNSLKIGVKDNVYYTGLDLYLYKSPVGGSEYLISSNPDATNPGGGSSGTRRKIVSSSIQFKHNLYILPQQIGNYTYKTESSDSFCFYFWGDPDWNVSCDMKISNVYGLIPDPPRADPQLIWTYE
jgi:hypothetical protein